MTTKFEVGKMAIVSREIEDFDEGEIVKVLEIMETWSGANFASTKPKIKLVVKSPEGWEYNVDGEDLLPLNDDSIYLKATELLENSMRDKYTATYSNYRFDVNPDKRTVKMIFHYEHDSGIVTESKCHKDDLFNEDLGKLICVLKDTLFENKVYSLEKVYKELDEFEQVRRNDRIGKEGKKIHIDDLWGKMFNSKPNEETIVSLRGELQVPPKNFDEINSSSITSIGSPTGKITGGIITSKDINSDKTELLTSDINAILPERPDEPNNPLEINPWWKSVETTKVKESGYVHKPEPTFDFPEFSMSPDSVKKPPRGIMPKYIWLEKRLDEIKSAIEQYVSEGHVVPIEWIEEYNELVNNKQ